ncbi:hypothetical protein [Rhodoblastus sp.]|uniref:hypothetical protein n=1 Tax=Rhodoblastus sp. TaxID=1962975 RepID=UPI003F9CFFB5
MQLNERLSALIKHDEVTTARAAYQAAHERIAGLKKNIAALEEKAAEVEAEKATIMDAIAKGERVSESDRDAVVSHARKIAEDLEFTRGILARVEADLPALDEDLSRAAPARAYAPLFDHAIEMRIAAAKEVDAAKAVLAKAESKFLDAHDVMMFAARNGAKWPDHLHNGLRRVVNSEAEERRIWRRPAVAPKLSFG